MSEITDLTKAVKELTSQLKNQGGGGGGGPRPSLDDVVKERQVREEMYKLDVEAAKTSRERQELKRKYHTETIDSLKKEAAIIGEGNDGYDERIDQLKDLRAEQAKTSKSTKALSRDFDEGAAKADTLGNALLKVDGGAASLAKHLPVTITQLGGFATGMAKGIVTGKIFSQVLTKIISNSINFALAVDKQNAAFRAATGAGNEYSSVINDAGLRFKAYGINAADAGAATQALFGTFRDFTNLSTTEQTTIATTTATLRKFGVETGTTAKILDQATKSLYMNATQAEALTRQAATLAMDIGKPISEVASDLASAAPKLAFYGNQMFEVFAQLERQSKATGLSVDQLLGVFGDQFDTFEGSGQAVGRLNAILGGPYLNSITMLNATESERLELVKEAINAGNVQFDQLNKFEQKAFARALGTDVDSLRRSLNELDPEAQLQAMTQKELAERAGEARDVMTKLKDSINSLVISLSPMITKISEGIDRFAKFIQQINDGTATVKGMTFGVDKLARGLFAVALGFKAIGFLLRPFKFLPNLLSNSAKGMGDLATQTGRASSASGLFNLSARSVLKGGAFGLAGGAAGMGTDYAAGKLQASGRTSAAQGVSIAGGAAEYALYGAALGSIIPGLGTGLGAGIGGAVGLAKGVYDATKIQDGAFVENEAGKMTVTNLNSQDRVNQFVATKPGGVVDTASSKNTDKIVDAIARSGNVQVNVQIGEEQIAEMVVKAMNSFKGKQAISPFHQGQG